MSGVQAQGLGSTTTEIDLLEAIASPINVEWDYVELATPTATQEVYTFKSGGSGGVTVKTLTVNYTDASKNTLLNATAA